MTLEVFPIVFQENRGYSPVIGSLPFLGLFVGVCAAIGINLSNQPRYARIVDANGGKPVPEARCAPMAVGGILFAIGLFWFGWTADPKIPCTFSSILLLTSLERDNLLITRTGPAPVVAAVFIGSGFNIIFQQCINFLVDTYQLYAASAVSGNTFLRSILAAAFPLVASPMFHNLGVGPAVSILGGIAVIAIPVPFIFMKYGLALRKKSRFAPVDD